MKPNPTPETPVKLSPAEKSKNLIATILSGGLTDSASDLEKKISGENQPEEPPPDNKTVVEDKPPVTPPPAPKNEDVEEDPFASPGAPEPAPAPEVPVGDAEKHSRAMSTIRKELEKTAGEKTRVEGELTAANKRITEMEQELENLRKNPGAPVFQPVTESDALKDPTVTKHLDSLSATINNLLGDVSEGTAALLEPDIKKWMTQAGEVGNDPAKRREFIAAIEQEFPQEDGRSVAKHLIEAAGLSREVSEAAQALMAEPAKNGMLRARQDYDGRKQTLAADLTKALTVDGTRLAEKPYHPLSFIAASVAGDDKWKADSARAMQDTLEIFSGVEPLSEADMAAFSGAFDDSAGKEITRRREDFNKRIKPAVVQLYAIKMLAPLLEPALQALAEKQGQAAKRDAERTAASGTTSPAPPAVETPEKGPTNALDILRLTGLYPKK